MGKKKKKKKRKHQQKKSQDGQTKHIDYTRRHSKIIAEEIAKIEKKSGGRICLLAVEMFAKGNNCNENSYINPVFQLETRDKDESNKKTILEKWFFKKILFLKMLLQR